ncbi:hypothetical protein LXL04_028654 [Taraxacum kok-saghyz]
MGWGLLYSLSHTPFDSCLRAYSTTVRRLTDMRLSVETQKPRLTLSPALRKANCLLAGSCMSGNVHVRLREKGGGQKWPCCTSLSSSMGSALSFFGEYANMILMRCGALHLTFVGLPSSGACVPAFLCNKPLRPKTSGRWSRAAFGKR